MNNKEIFEMTKLLINYTKTDEMKEIKNRSYQDYRLKIDSKPEFKEFSLNYPGLFNKIIDDSENFELNRLKEMLIKKTKISKNKISYEDATKQIGEKYYNEFVKSQIE